MSPARHRASTTPILAAAKAPMTPVFLMSAAAGQSSGIGYRPPGHRS